MGIEPIVFGLYFERSIGIPADDKCSPNLLSVLLYFELIDFLKECVQMA